VHFAGRLGTYKYYNMDQVVAQALTLAEKLTGQREMETFKAPSQSTKVVGFEDKAESPDRNSEAA
jgi:UDP-galactopyranose mutase